MPPALPLSILDDAAAAYYVWTYAADVLETRLVYANHAAARRRGYADRDEYLAEMTWQKVETDRRRLVAKVWPELVATGRAAFVLDLDDGAAQVLAEKITPPDGGAPLVFVSMTPAPCYDHLREIRAQALELADSIRLPSAVMADQDKAARLTERQREVATLLAAGLKAGEIAESLGVSTHTIAGHVRAIRQILKITGPTVAGLRALPRVLAALD